MPFNSETYILVERTKSGIARARATGKQFGRPPSLDQAERKAVLKRLRAGVSVAEVAREFNTSRQTILRVRDAGGIT